MDEQFTKDIIDYLNMKADTKFRYNSLKTKKRIESRVQEGYTLDDFKKVIDLKVNEWKDTTMDKYIRPDTLFGLKFESYLNQKEVVKTDKPIVKEVYKIEGYEDYLKLMMKMPYQDYIKTDHWLHFRKEALYFFSYQCQLCNVKDVEMHIHHKTYENRGRETFNDVIALCSDCHKLAHGIK